MKLSDIQWVGNDNNEKEKGYSQLLSTNETPYSKATIFHDIMGYFIEFQTADDMGSVYEEPTDDFELACRIYNWQPWR